MKVYIYLILLTMSLPCFAQNNTEIPKDILIAITGSQKKDFLNGAVPAILTITNNTRSEIAFDFDYPRGLDYIEFYFVFFDCESDIVIKKQRKYRYQGRYGRKRVPPGETYTATYYLNRYFDFIKEGKTEIQFRFNTSFDLGGGKSERVFYKTSFPIELVKGTDEELRTQFSYYSDSLKSEDRKIRNEAAEALSFIDSPLCIDYVIPMLSVYDLAVTGIKILSKFNTEKVRNALFGMFNERGIGVVDAAIEALNSMKVAIPRDTFIKLLDSPNADNRLIGLRQLQLNPDVNDRPYIEPLTNDLNPKVITKAKEYILLLDSLNQTSHSLPLLDIEEELPEI